MIEPELVQTLSWSINVLFCHSDFILERICVYQQALYGSNNVVNMFEILASAPRYLHRVYCRKENLLYKFSVGKLRVSINNKVTGIIWGAVSTSVLRSPLARIMINMSGRARGNDACAALTCEITCKLRPLLEVTDEDVVTCACELCVRSILTAEWPILYSLYSLLYFWQKQLTSRHAHTVGT